MEFNFDNIMQYIDRFGFAAVVAVWLLYLWTVQGKDHVKQLGGLNKSFNKLIRSNSESFHSLIKQNNFMLHAMSMLIVDKKDNAKEVINKAIIDLDINDKKGGCDNE